MPRTMRPSGLASTGYYKDHADYLIFCGGWNIGRIYEIRSGPEELRWFWALHFPKQFCIAPIARCRNDGTLAAWDYALRTSRAHPQRGRKQSTAGLGSAGRA